MSMDTSFTPKSLTAPEYVRALFEPADNAAVLVRNHKNGKIIQRIARAETIASPEFQEWLAAQSTAGADVYVGMNPIKDGAYGRTKDHIKAIRHVYLDLDRSGDESLEAIRNSSTVPPPNFVLDTSPGKHQVIWKVSGFSQEEAESVLHMLANQFGGDMAATDSTRVLRLPGFANHKLPQEFIVQGRQESNGVYSRSAFTIDEGTPESPRHLSNNDGRSHALQADHKSQSERDWASRSAPWREDSRQRRSCATLRNSVRTINTTPRTMLAARSAKPKRNSRMHQLWNSLDLWRETRAAKTVLVKRNFLTSSDALPVLHA